MSEWSGFHPQTARWFAERFGEPTEIQRASHPAVSSGEHVLITAPTGSGKTLAAFLYALDRLLSGAWPTGRLSVLYVSPLKALNTDIRENLDEPLAGLRQAFGEAPTVRTATRSGDTSQAERRGMLKNPPDILTTTPESLNLLLSSRGGRSILGDVRTLILDEVHAVAGSKRGVHLATAVERLVRLSGEFQRVALSATVRPADAVARFVGGDRPVRVVTAADEKVLRLSVHTVETDAAAEPRSPWEPMVAEFSRIVAGNRSSLFFTTNRRDAERIAMLLNAEADTQIAYAHHGSLSREVRELVERRMRAGELSAIVATSSLELGIDIGSIDEVIFAKAPFSVTSCLQMAGRAGHRVGAPSRARIFPLFGRDCLNAIVIARAAVDRDIEPVSPVRKPLDVLAQVLLSMIAMEPQNLEELFGFIRGVSSYSDLTREEFDAVIDLLAGKYRATRLRELEPRITVDRLAGTASARPGVQRLLYHSGGTIPDRGYYELRRAESGARVGELDEEFVWERRIGEVFVLGNQAWRIARITDRDVLVEAATDTGRALPFWRGEPIWRHLHLSERLLEFLEAADGVLEGGAADGTGSRDAAVDRLSAWIGRTAGGTVRPGEVIVSGEAAGELAAFLLEQREHTGVGLPHRRRVVLEHLAEDETLPTVRIILHTLWGGALNYPLSLLLAAALEEATGTEVTATAENDAVLVELPRLAEAGTEADGAAPADADGAAAAVYEVLRSLPESMPQMIRRLRGRLEASAFFGGRFRENAGRALLLPKAGFDRRMPLWLTRRRSRRLLEAVRRFDDFPITLETWRTCLDDYFDLAALSGRIGELRDGRIEIVTCRTRSASPLARNLLWQTTNAGIYETDTGAAGPAAGVSEEAIRRTLLTPSLRPAFPDELVEQFRRRLQRTAVGYAPTDAPALIAWVAERAAVPAAEWAELTAAVRRDAGEDAGAEALAGAASRLVSLHRPGGGPGLVASVEEVPRIARAWGLGPDELAPAPPGGAASESDAAVPGRDAGSPPDGLLERAVETEPAERSAESREEAVHALVSTWLRYEPPRTRGEVATALGLEPAAAGAAVDALLAADEIADEIRVGADEAPRICDLENLEWLLRRLRASSRPTVSPKPVALAVPFLAARQGLPAPGGSFDEAVLEGALEPLLGYPARAELWEEAILPARVPGYRGMELDRLFRESELLWFSVRPKEIAVAFRGDLQLFCDAAPEAGAGPEDGVTQLLAPGARMAVSDLARHARVRREVVRDALWAAAWRGEVTADSFAPVRTAVRRRFKPEADTATPGSRTAREDTRQEAAAAAGNAGPRRRRAGGPRGAGRRWRDLGEREALWSSIAGELECDEQGDLIDRLELEKDRVRMLLDRYGIVFRELLADELPGFRWRDVFGALRLMELGGEVLVGQFFDGVPGVQFARPEAVARLEELAAGTGGRRGGAAGVFVVNAADPAAPCGWGLEGLGYEVPRKHPGTWLAFDGARLLLVARRNGAEVDITVPPADETLGEAMKLFDLLTGREFRPLARITVRAINGEDPTESPYRALFEAAGFRADFRALVRWAGYR